MLFTRKKNQFAAGLQQKSPVRVTGTKRKQGATDDYQLIKEAKIKPVSLDFAYNESCAHNMLTVEKALAANLYETLDLKVRVITKPDKKKTTNSQEWTDKVQSRLHGSK